jgi:two-component system cell cycle response regulator
LPINVGFDFGLYQSVHSREDFMDMFTVFALGLSATEEREMAMFCKFASRKTHSWSPTPTLRKATGVVLGSALPAHIAAAVAFQAAGGRVILLDGEGQHARLTAVRRPLQLDRAFAIFNHFKTQFEANPRVPHESAFAAFEAAFPAATGSGTHTDPAKVLPLIRAPLTSEPATGVARPQQVSAPTVLVVDDSPVAQNYLRNRVLAMGLECDVATSGDEALLMIAQTHYAVVLLDIHMEGIDGYQTCRAIKNFKGGPAVSKVVMTSSKTGTVDKIRATLAGCDGYLTKPISDIALARTLSTLIKLGVASPASETHMRSARPPSQATP